MARRCDPWQFARLGDVSFDIDARDEEIVPVYFHPSHAYLPEEWYGQRLEVEATKKGGVLECGWVGRDLGDFVLLLGFDD